LETGVHLKLTHIKCCEYGSYYINPENVSFISCGEVKTASSGAACTEIFIHFTGGKESAMILVEDVEAAINALNQIT
jgi:hypothetical protein